MILRLLAVAGIIFLAFIVSALPLHFAVKFFGGKTNVIKTLVVMLFGSFLVSLVRGTLGIFGGLAAFVVLIWLYRISFHLGWAKAILVWLLQFVILALFFMLGMILFGTIGLMAMIFG